MTEPVVPDAAARDGTGSPTGCPPSPVALPDPQPSPTQRIGLVLELVTFTLLWEILALLGPATGPLRIEAGPLLGYLAILAPLTTLLIVGMLRLRGQSLRDVGLARPARGWRRAVAIGLGAGLVIMGLNWGLSNLTDGMGLWDEHDAVFVLDGALDRLGFYGCSFFAGFYEELVYRGYLLIRMQALFARAGRPRWGLGMAVAATSLWFGAVHVYQGSGAAITVTVMGVAFALLVVLSRRNLVPAMVAHAVVDLLAFSF